MVKNAKYLEILPLLSCEWGNPSDNGEGKIQNAILRFQIFTLNLLVLLKVAKDGRLGFKMKSFI